MTAAEALHLPSDAPETAELHGGPPTYGLPLLLSPEDVARVLRMSDDRVRQWRLTGYLPPAKEIGPGKRKSIRWRRDDLIAWLRDHDLIPDDDTATD